MAQVRVRVKIDKEFEVMCDGCNAEECLNNISDQDRLDELVQDYIYDDLTVVSGTYDEPEAEDEDENDEDNDSDA